MLKISNESKVGIFTLVTLVILILGYSFMKGRNVFNSPDVYYAYYNKIEGLVESNPVILYGYKVGKVEKITITNIKGRNILVKFTVKNEVLLPIDSRARIVSTDLIGAKGIELKLGIEKRTARSSDTLLGETEQGLVESVSDMLDPIKQKATSMLTTIDNVMSDLQIYLSRGGRRDLGRTLEGLKNLILNLESTTGSLNNFVSTETMRMRAILKNLETLSVSLEENAPALENALTNLSDFSDTLKAANIASVINDIGKTVNEIDVIAKKINSGNGTLGQLVYDDSLYNNLELTTKNLNSLLIDLQSNPRRYINLSLISTGGGKKK
jgi:phospholipid/cholesterol/gamma-HCH transport system substrate-binding protein